MNETVATYVDQRIVWATLGLTLDIGWDEDSAPALLATTTVNGRVEYRPDVPLVEILAAGYGHSQANGRLIQTSIGRGLRYESHTIGSRAAASTDIDPAVQVDGRDAAGAPVTVDTLELVLVSVEPALRVTVTLVSYSGTAVVRSVVSVQNSGAEALTLQSVTSWASGFGSPAGAPHAFGAWSLVEGQSDWLAEGRWNTEPLRGPHFPVIQQELTGNQPRGSHSVVSKGSWSTGAVLPVGAIVSEELGLAMLWQIEHNGAWRWEVGENTGDGYLALSGPTELDHSWSGPLATGDAFTSVPVSVAFGATLVAAVAELTAFRRADRRAHVDNIGLPVVFNDYMNTLNGDPTTERLIPLIDSAAAVGAEVFCIDAGWYDDGGDWWDSVGEWVPSTVRFPGGLGEVIDHIRDRGMVPGLWVEPEVVGVRSPAAATLPSDAFFQRDGHRLVEHERFHLDLRHPAAVVHLNDVVDRLVRDFGIGFFKFDYNIDPGIGTDVGAGSLGEGLLGHNRALLAWLDGVAARHPHLVIENCASGAMRTDWAMLSRLQVQSTSDQQDFRLYPPIAASAPMSMLPEQAASWAYPQPEMTEEQVAFCLVTGLLGRFYVSGYLNFMTEAQRSVVAEAIVVAKQLRGRISRSTPQWPLGLPRWEDDWVSLALAENSARLVTIWKRTAAAGEVALAFPDLVGHEVTVRTVFPTALPEWETTWDARTGTLTVFVPTATEAARTIELSTGHKTGDSSAIPKTE